MSAPAWAVQFYDDFPTCGRVDHANNKTCYYCAMNALAAAKAAGAREALEGAADVWVNLAEDTKHHAGGFAAWLRTLAAQPMEGDPCPPTS